MKPYSKPVIEIMRLIYDENCPPCQMYIYMDKHVSYIYPLDAPRRLKDLPGWNRG